VKDNQKSVPYNIDAEEAVLGSILIDGEYIDKIDLAPADFFSEQNSLIFESMQIVRLKGVTPDQITVAQNLHESGKLDKAGGAATLSTLVANCPTPLDCVHYADIVKKCAGQARIYWDTVRQWYYGDDKPEQKEMI